MLFVLLMASIASLLPLNPSLSPLPLAPNTSDTLVNRRLTTFNLNPYVIWSSNGLYRIPSTP